jgi:hypothetical protein
MIPIAFPAPFIRRVSLAGGTHLRSVPFNDLTATKKVRRILVGFAGGMILLVGVALIMLPGPAFLVIPAGLAILAIEFLWARRLLQSVKEFAKRKTRFLSRTRVPAIEKPAVSCQTPQPFAKTADRMERDALSRFEGEGGRVAPLQLKRPPAHLATTESPERANRSLPGDPL